MNHFDHWLHAWLQTTGSTGEAAFELLLAATLGGLVGLEREIRGREAGFRTNLLVALGSALVMIVSIEFARRDWAGHGSASISVDPGRIAYGVMTGIGFLGAGAILKHGSSVHGLTTAAGLWCVAAIGLASGFGMYTVAILSTIMVVVALWFLDQLEHHLPRRRFRKLVVRVPWRDGFEKELLESLARAGIKGSLQSFQRRSDPGEVEVELLVTLDKHETSDQIAAAIRSHPQCHLISFEST
jgi:putative Mg2+ transporter-C (MgtC) family protein